jgi:flagellar biosynthetic protein FliR
VNGDLTTAAAFLLALCRTGGWVVAMPVLGGRGVASYGRLALAIGLAIFFASTVTTTQVPLEIGPFITAALTETAIGLTIGWLVSLAIAAIEVSGHFIDFLGGFSASAILDPISNTSAAVFSRMMSITLAVLLFVSPAMSGLVRGFALSFRLVPLGAHPATDANSWSIVAGATTGIMTSAITIAAPVLGGLLLTEAGLALAARFVPQANVFYLGLPVKAIVTLSLMGTALALMPSFIPRLIEIGNNYFGQIVH